MNLAAINQTIKAMCPEVEALGVGNYNWRFLTEEELLYEAASCMFSSQMRFEVAVAAADHVRASGLLRCSIT